MQSDSQIYNLKLPEILGLASYECFFDNFWENQVHFNDSASDSLITEILTLNQFESLMASASGGLSVVNHQRAQPVDCDVQNTKLLSHLFGLYRQGCTILLSSLQQRWDPIANLCRQIENDLISHRVLLKEAIGANGYLTPPNSQGFDIHYDDHCVIILQLYGEKDWTIFPPVDVLPINRCQEAYKRDQLQPPLLDTCLHQGDALYIPRGFPHFASTGDKSSLHLTLSLRTLTWVDVFTEVLQNKVDFRNSIRQYVNGAQGPQNHFKHKLLPQLMEIKLAPYFSARRIENLSRLKPLSCNRLQAMDNIQSVDSETLVQRVPLTNCMIQEVPGWVSLVFPGGNLRLPSAMKPVFEFIVNTKIFSSNQLPAIHGDYDRLEFTRILVKKGLVVPRVKSKIKYNKV